MVDKVLNTANLSNFEIMPQGTHEGRFTVMQKVICSTLKLNK